MIRRWRLGLVAVVGVATACAGTVLAVAVNVLTGGTAGWFVVLGVGAHPLRWTVGATAGVALTGLGAWESQRWYERGLKALAPAIRQPEFWVVRRPMEVGQVVAALHRGGSAGITTAIHGAGGFGKTTLAELVGCDPRVLRRFKGRVYWVTLGRDLPAAALGGKVSDLIRRMDPDRAASFTDASQAADQLAAVLAAGPRRLVIVDDVWTEDQLAAFPVAGRSARLVTTRNRSLATGTVIPVPVDRMSSEQARELISAGLPQIDTAVAGQLAEAAGRWPLLLHLVCKTLAAQAQANADINRAGAGLLQQLRAGEAVSLKDPKAAGVLDVAEPLQRRRAVRATIEASAGMLTAGDRARLLELGVFAEDETVPVSLVAAFWQDDGRIGGAIGQAAAGEPCARLSDLALIFLHSGEVGGTWSMHDVIRDFLRDELGEAKLTRLHQRLLGVTAAELPQARSAAPTRKGNAAMMTAWWELPATARYLRTNLMGHLLAAGRAGEAAALATDLRWAATRLDLDGPAAVSADLALAGTPQALRLGRIVGQTAHLLATTTPPHSRVDILLSRVNHDSDWGSQARALADTRHHPGLTSLWPLPDLPPALRRVLNCHKRSVNGVAIAPDGTWLATASDDGIVGLWDVATGQLRTTLIGHGSGVNAVAIAPDSTWLATASHDWTVRLWDAATGQLRATLRGRSHESWVSAVAIAPDGTWLATASDDDTVRLWDVATSQLRATLRGHKDRVNAVAIAPNGAWLATASSDRTVRLWSTTNGQLRATLTGHTIG